MLNVGVAKELRYVAEAKMGVAVMSAGEVVAMEALAANYPEADARMGYYLEEVVGM